MRGYSAHETSMLLMIARKDRFRGSREQLAGLVRRGLLVWATPSSGASIGVATTVRGELAILCVLALTSRGVCV